MVSGFKLKKLNARLVETAKFFVKNNGKLLSFINDVCKKSAVWYKGEPYNFIHGIKIEKIVPNNEYENITVKENVIIEDSIYNPYNVYCIYRTHRTHNKFSLHDFNVVFIYNNILLHWDYYDDIIRIYNKPSTEQFVLDSNFFPQRKYFECEASGREYHYNNNLCTNKKIVNELYDFLTVLNTEFSKSC